jgi:IS5 family transposase
MHVRRGLGVDLDGVLAAKGFLAMGGQIIDATLIAAPRQKLTLEENATIREGGTPEGWSRAKRAQKDQDARWTLKRGRAKPNPTARSARPSKLPCRSLAPRAISASTSGTG